jgi:hypothetical protein
MTITSIIRRLFARPAQKALACFRPTMAAVEDRTSPTTTSESAGRKAKKHRESSTTRDHDIESPAQTVRFKPVTIGFWLGGGLLGTAGCILGVCMPYHHPVAVAISVLWWGIYLGFLGASLGVLVAYFVERTPVAGQSMGEVDRQCRQRYRPPVRFRKETRPGTATWRAAGRMNWRLL